MGYGMPAAIAAKLILPERRVVAIADDQCFQMSIQELGTATQYGADIVVLVFKYQSSEPAGICHEQRHEERDCAADRLNPDFARLRRSYGALAGSQLEPMANSKKPWQARLRPTVLW